MTSGLEGVGSLVRQLITKFQPDIESKKVSQLNNISISINLNRQRKISQTHEQLQGIR
jgi:hypothetical protein